MDKKKNEQETDLHGKGNTDKDQPVNEIDDFTQKLLDKRVEMALFPDEDDFTSSSLEGSLSEAQRKTAEDSMQQALDQLRKERGQRSIEEEEEEYDLLYPSKNKPVSNKTAEQQARDFYDVEPNRYETRSRQDHFEKQEKRPGHGPLTKRAKITIFVLVIILLAAMFGGYYWKVAVYDPAHVTDTAQEEAWKRLVNYADEYSMMSDAQKQEILKLEEDYNSLPEGKKKEINEYFANPKHTGKSFVALFAEIRSASLAESNPGLSDLLAYVSNYGTLDEAGQNDIVNRVDVFNALTQEGKDLINLVLKDQTGSDFLALVDQANKRIEQQEPASENSQAEQTQPQADQNTGNEQAQTDQTPTDTTGQDVQYNDNTDVTQKRLELASLIADRDEYISFLDSEGLSHDDEILNEYNAKIADLRAQLGYSD